MADAVQSGSLPEAYLYIAVHDAFPTYLFTHHNSFRIPKNSTLLTNSNIVAVVDDPPPGWGSKPEDLEYEDDWEAEDTFGQYLCEQMNLGRGRPIMCHCTDHAYLFEAGGKFYLWYCVGLDVFEITSPTTLDEIIKTMKGKGDEAVKTKRIV